MAERTRIAREMHDVLAHRISLLALHAGGLEVRPDLPPEQVQETAALLRATARQALEELRSVIGVLRESEAEEPTPAAPQPTLTDLARLVEDTRRAGTDIDFEMHVEHVDEVPAALGRDAYRIVQEALTNVGKHAPGAAGTGPGHRRPRTTVCASASGTASPSPRPGPRCPGQERDFSGCANGSPGGWHPRLGPEESGDFVVEAELTW